MIPMHATLSPLGVVSKIDEGLTHYGREDYYSFWCLSYDGVASRYFISPGYLGDINDISELKPGMIVILGLLYLAPELFCSYGEYGGQIMIARICQVLDPELAIPLRLSDTVESIVRQYPKPTETES